MRACLSSVDTDAESLVEKARRAPAMEHRELASAVTCREPYSVAAEGEERFHVVCYDFGVKTNSLRELAAMGCRVTIVPATTPAGDVLARRPDGIFLSNGPGDPAAMTNVVEEVRRVAESGVPTFGICFGHQLLGRAFGGTTYKLRFGHRGGNQPVKDLQTGAVEITSHNHGFAVSADSLPADVQVTHVNLNDDCVEGMSHRRLPVFSVQYHPEASPGPQDSHYLFGRFVEAMRGWDKQQGNADEGARD